MIWLLVSFFTCRISAATNYISNGGFENPNIPPDGYSTNNAVDWEGVYEIKGPTGRPYNLGHNQYVDLQRTPGVNGYAQQIVSLPKDGYY